MKDIQIWENWETPSEIIVKGSCTKEKALELAKKEYPETCNIYNLENVRKVTMNKCLDCGSYWINSEEKKVFNDGICGECGEPRLGKRNFKGYLIY